jgi:hypothetical protein
MSRSWDPIGGRPINPDPVEAATLGQSKRRKRQRSPFAPTPSALPPTARQDEFLAAIGELTAQLGRGPSTVEIAERLGITRDGCRSQLRALERKGAIGDIPKTVRSGRWTLMRDEK